MHAKSWNIYTTTTSSTTYNAEIQCSVHGTNYRSTVAGRVLSEWVQHPHSHSRLDQVLVQIMVETRPMATIMGDSARQKYQQQIIDKPANIEVTVIYNKKR